MKILFLVDYYTPFNPGGSEWSVYYLVKQLKEKNIETKILTINYGAKQKELVSGIEVIRFPFYKKLKNFRKVVNPIYQNNPLFFLWSGYWIYKISKDFKPDIIHINGKFTIPGAILSSWLLGIPTIVSLRDKQLLCSIGRCFFEENRYRVCNFIEYLYIDIPWLYKNYTHNKNIAKFIYIYFGAIWTRIAYKIIAFFAKKSKKIIAISYSQKKYLNSNGFTNVSVIHNSAIFNKVIKHKRKNQILFAGKLSLGKGIYKLLNSIPLVLLKHKILFIFAGSIDDKEKVNKVVNELKIKKYIKFLNGVDHHKLQALYGTSKLTVVPSVFPEAFGRVALESIVSGTPVVVSNRGGLQEIIECGKSGEISNLATDDLAQKINKVLYNYQRYINYILRNYTKMKKKFEVQPLSQHIKLYKLLTK